MEKYKLPSFFYKQLIQYLERDWSVKTAVPADPPEFGVWTFNSYDSAGKTSLQLGVRFENLNNGLTMTIYCPFWMLNKTGLNLSYRVSLQLFLFVLLFHFKDNLRCFRKFHNVFCSPQRRLQIHFLMFFFSLFRLIVSIFSSSMIKHENNSQRRNREKPRKMS